MPTLDHPRRRQTLLLEHDQVGPVPTYPNLPPTGDIIPQERPDGHIRIAFQNIHGATLRTGLQLSPEIDVLSEWNIDIMGMSETN